MSDERVDTLHQEVDFVKTRLGEFGNELASVKSDIGHLSDQVARVVRAMEGMTTSISTIGKTDWKTLSSAGMLLIAALVYHGELRTTPLHQNDMAHSERISTLEQEFRSHEKISAHVGMGERYSHISDDIDEIKSDIKELHRLTHNE